MLEVKTDIGGVECNVLFQRKVNILKGDSGTGKSWLFRLLQSYFVANGISYYFVNYLTRSEPETIIAQAKKVQYLLLDNADLYLNSDTIGELLQCDATCIVATRLIKLLDIRKMGFYKVVYKDEALSVSEVSQ